MTMEVFTSFLAMLAAFSLPAMYAAFSSIPLFSWSMSKVRLIPDVVTTVISLAVLTGLAVAFDMTLNLWFFFAAAFLSICGTSRGDSEGLSVSVYTAPSDGEIREMNLSKGFHVAAPTIWGLIFVGSCLAVLI
jgi:hypothetical protein